MAYLDLPFVLVRSPEMLQLLQQVQWSVNIMTEENFPHPLSADRLLADFSAPLRKLAIREWIIPLVSSGTPVTTAGTLNCGGYWQYNPVNYPNVNWFFEAVLMVTTGVTATARLLSGASTVATVQSTGTGWAIVRTAQPVTMPIVTSVLHVQLEATAASANLFGARMICVP